MSLQHIGAGGHDPNDPVHPVMAGKKLIDLVHNDATLRQIVGLPTLQQSKRHGTVQKAIRNPISKRPSKMSFRSVAASLNLVADRWVDTVYAYSDSDFHTWCSEIAHDVCRHSSQQIRNGKQAHMTGSSGSPCGYPTSWLTPVASLAGRQTIPRYIYSPNDSRSADKGSADTNNHFV